MMKFHRETEAMKMDCFHGADSDIIAQVNREIILGWQMKIQLARAAQARKKAAMDRLASYSLEGIGEHFLSVDRESFMYWGTREGFECWEDQEFLEEYHRDNETARVNHTLRPRFHMNWDRRLEQAVRARGEAAEKPVIVEVTEDFRAKEAVS